jgi:hypothetical protein
MSGSKYGHDLDAATREAVQAKVKELEALQLPVKVEQGALTGSNWTTVFTTSDGALCCATAVMVLQCCMGCLEFGLAHTMHRGDVKQAEWQTLQP